MDKDQLSLFGKTYPELSQVTEDQTLGASLKNLSKSSSRKPLCLRFRKVDGHMQIVTSGTDGALLTELLTRNTSERLRDEEGYTLSSILEANVPEKYYLSAKACEGILRRAQKRKKKLPQMLEEALLQMIERERAQ